MNKQPVRPNVIVIVTDDQGYGDVGVFGGTDLKTPNIDKLFNSGVRFTNWYSNSPVCAPARASMMTGKYPEKAGVPDLLGIRKPGLHLKEKTIADAFKSLHYKTALIGKWHLGGALEYRPNKRGFDYFFGILEGCVDYFSHMYFLPRSNRPFHDLWRNEEPAWEDGKYLTHLISSESKNFILENLDNPFYLNIAYNGPHYPLQVPRNYIDEFKGLTSERQAIAALIKAVDDGIGEIIALLDEHKMLENTIIFFQSDNGSSNEMRNFYYDHEKNIFNGGSAGGLKGNKGSLFEGGIKVPAAIYWEGHLPSGIINDQIGIGMDIFPTLLSMAGSDLKQYENIDGKDLSQMIKNGDKSPHECLFWEYLNQKAVRKDGWKLIVNGKLDFERPAQDSLILINLNDDPGESNNLSDSEPLKLQELKSELNNWDKITSNPYDND